MRSLAVIGFFALVLAGATTAAEDGKVVTGDMAAGAKIYAETCLACHGTNGNSVVAAQPILAGQHAYYLYEQLKEYKEGTRANAVMAQFVAKLADQDMADVAVFLAAQQAGLSGADDKELALAGEQLYRRGSEKVVSCLGCHGPAGQGIPPEYPRLSGQHAEYVITTLTEFRTKKRINLIMNEVAADLSDDDIKALAEYISGLY